MLWRSRVGRGKLPLSQLPLPFRDYAASALDQTPPSRARRKLCNMASSSKVSSSLFTIVLGAGGQADSGGTRYSIRHGRAADSQHHLRATDDDDGPNDHCGGLEDAAGCQEKRQFGPWHWKGGPLDPTAGSRGGNRTTRKGIAAALCEIWQEWREEDQGHALGSVDEVCA